VKCSISNIFQVAQRQPKLKYQMEEGSWPSWKKTLSNTIWNRKQYKERIKTFDHLKSKVGFEDPRLVFDIKKLKLETAYSAQQLFEIHPFLREALMDLIPGSIINENFYQNSNSLLNLAYGTPDYKKRLEDNNKELTEGGMALQKNFNFSRVDYEQYNQLDQDLLNIHAIDDVQYVNSALDILLSPDKQGFLLGENHKEEDTKQFLVKSMTSLKWKGVNTLYIEHFRTEYQDILNHYFSANYKDAMPEPLKRYIMRSDERWGLKDKANNLMKVVLSAKQAGIKLVGVDDMQAKGTLGDPEARARKMNYLVNKIVTNDERHDAGKYVVFTGAAHNIEFPGEGKPVPGLSQLLDVPALVISDSKLRVDRKRQYSYNI
jgi:hypothetical protein